MHAVNPVSNDSVTLPSYIGYRRTVNFQGVSHCTALWGVTLDSNLLREFLHRSRDWSSVSRGADLFQSAANILTEVVEIDSGFFIYKKRIPSAEATRFCAYQPWGVLMGHQKQLQLHVDDIVAELQASPSIGQRWFSDSEFPAFTNTLFGNLRLHGFGLWPLVSRGQLIGAFVAARTRFTSAIPSSDMTTSLLDVCVTQMSLALDLLLTCRIAEQKGQEDPLTGLLNRRGIEARLSKFVERIHGAGKHVVFGLIDINELKTINDTRGHPVGDQALCEVADVIRRNLRSNDLVARFGGDEFCVVTEADKSDVVQVMERIKRSVQLQSGYSVSVGGAIWGRDGGTLEQCYEIADVRLYECKRYMKGISP